MWILTLAHLTLAHTNHSLSQPGRRGDWAVGGDEKKTQSSDNVTFAFTDTVTLGVSMHWCTLHTD